MSGPVSQAIASRDKADQLIGWLRRQQDDVAMAAASHIKPATLIRVTQGALRRNEKLARAAIANPQSLLYALLECARLGHEPDTDQYYLVPFGNEVTGIEGYKGIIERMFRAGAVSAVVADVVRQRDVYRSRGKTGEPVHEYDEFADPDDRGPLRGAYAYAVMLDGRCSNVIRMGRAEILKHKAMSKGSDAADSPWQKWTEAMWKKCPVRGLEPYVPTSNEWRREQLRAAAETVPAWNGGATQFAAAVTPPVTIHSLPAEITEDVPAAGKPGGDDGNAHSTPEGVPGPAATPPVAAGHPTTKQGLMRVIRGHFDRIGIDDADERLIYTAKLAGLDPGTEMRDITMQQLRKAADALVAHCPDREALINLTTTGEATP